ncbi:MAG: hypothetical protein KJ571_19275 [Bacteroidetes bacterium]|nr:hypothetical protein [Bacteroidota bacterium]
MYHLDLTFLKGENITVDPKETENKFKNMIADEMCCNYHNISGCLACSVDHTFEPPFDERKIVEAESKGLLGHHFCELTENDNNIYSIGDMVIVDIEGFSEIARIVETGEIVKVKRQKFGFYGEDLPKVLRKSSDQDMDIYRENLIAESKARPIFRNNVEKYSLNMKLVDVHFQFDKKKLYFFYTSDGRVDFRELAKSLASEFKTRIELRQMGVRDEAKRIGGLGTCGREYCCSSFMNNFKKITTQVANQQNTSANISKLSGPCSKLKCCLCFEVDEN